MFTSACASCHDGVQFFIFHLASWLRTRRFSEPTFRPSGATKQWKNTVFRDFPTFSRTCIFSLLTFSISYLLPSDFSMSEFLPGSASSWLCFSSVHIGTHVVGSFTSKLPSTSTTTTTLPCLQPLFNPSVDLLCHPSFTQTNLSFMFPILKLPPPLCAVLLVILEFPGPLVCFTKRHVTFQTSELARTM